MSEKFLDNILDSTRQRVSLLKQSCNVEDLRARAAESRARRPANALRSALEIKNRINIIAEFKRASPSKGIINDHVDIANQVKRYEEGGACAVSILTEEQFFRGSLDDLQKARMTVDLPLLRKDFIVDEIQIYEAAASGADAVLLIVAALTIKELETFQRLAHDLRLDAIVEVHTAEELRAASYINAQIVGVNNRDLKTFDVSLDISRRLVEHRPLGALMIAESGIATAEQIDELRGLGFDGFLIGESLMRSSGMKVELEALT